jgi:hypothetical protein
LKKNKQNKRQIPVPDFDLGLWPEVRIPRNPLGSLQKRLQIKKYGVQKMYPQPQIDLVHRVVWSLPKTDAKIINPSYPKKNTDSTVLHILPAHSSRNEGKATLHSMST